MSKARYRVYSVKKSYPTNWREIASKVDSIHGAKCYKCKRSKKELNSLGINLEHHHLFSVTTGNNKVSNLVPLCSRCHEKMPGHAHLKKRR